MLRAAVPGLVLMVIAGVVLAAVAQEKTAGGTPPLTLQAVCKGQGPAATLHVEWQNTGGIPTSLAAGYTPAGTQTHVVNTLRVAVS